MLISNNICVIIPTKDRHHLLIKMLEGLVKQTVDIGQIIIADGGRDAKELVETFSDKLPVTWLDCPIAGQIPQRNLAFQSIGKNIDVIINLDDDIVLEPEALESLIEFWNSKTKEPAGVSFNLYGSRQQNNYFYRRVFCMALTPPGKVFRSGYNSPITELSKSIKTQWLLGGATAWRKDILLDRAHIGIATSWAICEDLIFSYPIGKEGDLYVCSDAKVHDIDNPLPASFAKMKFRGRNAVIWRYYFVCSHTELSRLLFFWMMIGQIIPRILIGLLGNNAELGNAVGHIEGFSKALIACIRKTDPKNILQ